MHRFSHLTRAHLLLLVLVLGALVALPRPQLATAQTYPPTTTPTALPNARPDACEPNNDARHACALSTDMVSGPFTFLPEGDQDFFSASLGSEPNGLQTTITVRGTTGLDLLTTITRADTGATIATIASPAISTTLAVDLTGWIILRVENRAPDLAAGQSYRVELRRSLPPAPVNPTPTGPEGVIRQLSTPDALENNYSPETAAPIGVGVVYDLTFVCPVLGSCPGGDHDYLRFEAKAGMRYLITTFDLAPGVDTVLDLFWLTSGQGWSLLTSNDDERPGAAFLSVLRWQAPGDGPVAIRIGPRDGGLNPLRTESDPAPSYRLAVALADSPLATQLEERIATQTGAPTATALPVVEPQSEDGGSGGSGGSTNSALPTPMPIADGTMSGGGVYLVENAVAYIAPEPSSAILAELLADSILTTTGKVSGLYVEVTSSSFVGPGWVDRRVLRPTTTAPATSPVATPEAGGAPLPGPTGRPGSSPASSSTTEPATDPTAVLVRALDPLPLNQPAPANAPIPVQVDVTVTVADGAGVMGLRLMLTNIFGDPYVETLTGADGHATLTTVVPSGDALMLLCPDLGISYRVTSSQATVTFQLPEVHP